MMKCPARPDAVCKYSNCGRVQENIHIIPRYRQQCASFYEVVTCDYYQGREVIAASLITSH